MLSFTHIGQFAQFNHESMIKSPKATKTDVDIKAAIPKIKHIEMVTNSKTVLPDLAYEMKMEPLNMKQCI